MRSHSGGPLYTASPSTMRSIRGLAIFRDVTLFKSERINLPVLSWISQTPQFCGGVYLTSLYYEQRVMEYYYEISMKYDFNNRIRALAK